MQLLDSGNGGVSEARAAVAHYDELSPLYGVIMYRRKKVLIKYIPEGTSRLLKGQSSFLFSSTCYIRKLIIFTLARTTVHLQDVLEKFSPYEAVVEALSADGLSDTTLAAAFPLHTAAPSININKLDEISEDAEEVTSPKKLADIPSPSSTASRRTNTERWPSRRMAASAPTPPLNGDAGKAALLTQKSSVSRFLVREEAGSQSVTPLDTPSMSEYAPSEATVHDNASIRSGVSGCDVTSVKSSSQAQSEHGDFDYEKYYAQLYKPKVKLGPRPVTLTEKARRPANASTPPGSRPVSSLPPGLQSRASPPEPPKSGSFSLFPRPPPIPSHDARSVHRPDSASGSVRSIPISTMSIKTSKSTMTPEKMRLMKAMEQRKKQMRKSTTNEPASSASSPEVDTETPHVLANKKARTSKDGAQQMVNKADSGISMNYEEHSRVDSHDESDGSDSFSPMNKADSEVSKEKAPGDVQPGKSDDPFSNESRILNAPAKKCSLPRSPGLASLVAIANLNHLVEDAQDSKEDAKAINVTKPDDLPALQPPTETEDTQEASAPESEKRSLDLQKKRRGWVEPLTLSTDGTMTSPDPENYLSDEDFMEELQSATVQEATPVSISRSPASPFFPGKNGRSQSIKSVMSGASVTTIVQGKRNTSYSNGSPKDRTRKDSREDALSVLVEPDRLAPEAQQNSQSRSHSVSSARTVDSERSDSIKAIRKNQLSSGISKRIQALAEHSVREGVIPVAASTPPPLSEKSSLVSMRKTSLQETAEAYAPPRPGSSLATRSPLASPTMARPDITVNRLNNCDSVSVTARIVRAAPGQDRKPSFPAELHHSPILINHTRPTHMHDFPPIAPILTENLAAETESISSPVDPRDRSLSPTFSFSSADGGSNSHRRSFDHRSFTSKSRAGQESSRHLQPRSPSTVSLMPEGKAENEKSSRTSRFFKRISHISGTSKRKSISQAPIVEEEAVVQVSAPAQRPDLTRKDSVPDIPPPIVVGDLNVQFPNTLLWKRRWVEIDSTGYVVFLASRPVSNAAMSKSRGFVTKFHLSELKAPYIPDVDRQEMPHSVLFDLADGAALSCASEDSMAQRQLMSCKFESRPKSELPRLTFS